MVERRTDLAHGQPMSPSPGQEVEVCEEAPEPGPQKKKGIGGGP